ncbi:MAG: glycosyltransferase, partial [Erysipelotrichia bacterium]|nr:glycosyltransferase [Erysipelotrichia bacterium]
AKGRTDFHMYWIGSDSNKDLVANQVVAQHDVADVVEFLGPQDYPRDYFEWGDIFLLTSREDPYPLVCMEAAECDMPVICFDEKAGGMYSFVENDAGIVVPYLDIVEMTNALEELLNDEQKRIMFGKNAKQKVKERHYVDIIAPQIIDFLPQTINVKATTALETYKRLIENASAISFDIFDTLVTRRLADPNVVFDVIEYKHTENESAALPLFNERMQTAGKVLGSYNGQIDDVSIDEIYQNMFFYKNSEIEKQTEIAMCITHPMGKQLYDYAKKLNKHIIITSDMYLDKDTVQAILKKNGIDGWDTFYLSSEQGKKKDTGKLFALLKEEAALKNIQPNKILHIGDNWIGDVKCAREAGIHAIRFSPLYEKPYKLIELDKDEEAKLSQIGKIWNSFTMQSTRLWRESHREQSSDFYTRLGFELTGPFASMMAMHTHALADQVGAKKIIFMARDGRIIKKAFDKLYADEIKQNKYISDYLHLSRATVIPATFEHPLSSNDIYFLMEGLHLMQKPISYFLKKAGLDIESETIITNVRAYFDSLDFIPKWEDLNTLSKMFTELSEEIYIANRHSQDALKIYLEQNDVLSYDKVIVVDVGWMINIQSR